MSPGDSRASTQRSSTGGRNVPAAGPMTRRAVRSRWWIRAARYPLPVGRVLVVWADSPWPLYEAEVFWP